MPLRPASDRRLPRALAAALIVFALAGLPAGTAAAGEVLVFAAASLKNALDDAAAAFTAKTGIVVKVSYAGTAALAKQLTEGAPADIFFSADEAWMDFAEEKGVVEPASRITLLANRLVLVAPRDSAVGLDIAPGFPLAAALGTGRLAMANVEAVPAGRYGKAALQSLGVWDSVAGRLAQTDNVRIALAYVARGEAPLGIVYETDAAAEPDVKIAGTFSQTSHPPIRYPLALVAGRANPDAARLAGFLASAEARPFFERQGFTVLPPGS